MNSSQLYFWGGNIIYLHLTTLHSPLIFCICNFLKKNQHLHWNPPIPIKQYNIFCRHHQIFFFLFIFPASTPYPTKNITPIRHMQTFFLILSCYLSHFFFFFPFPFYFPSQWKYTFHQIRRPSWGVQVLHWSPVPDHWRWWRWFNRWVDFLALLIKQISDDKYRITNIELQIQNDTYKVTNTDNFWSLNRF